VYENGKMVIEIQVKQMSEHVVSLPVTTSDCWTGLNRILPLFADYAHRKTASPCKLIS